MSYYQIIKDVQKNARRIDRERNRAVTQRKTNPAGKTRPLNKPYASWTDPSTGWQYKILKSWQADNSKEYARWFMWVSGDFAEMGDEYVAGVRSTLRYTELFSDYDAPVYFDETVWATKGEFAAWVWGEF